MWSEEKHPKRKKNRKQERKQKQQTDHQKNIELRKPGAETINSRRPPQQTGRMIFTTQMST